MEGFNAGTITIVLSIFGTGILVMLFQWRQNGASEKRLREDIGKVEERLREDAREMEERLRGEIQVVVKSVEKVEVTLNQRIERTETGINHRLDRTDDNVNALIQAVGVVQGAVVGVSVEASPREPVAPS